MRWANITVLSLAMMISLTGCSGINRYFENKMLEKSGVLEDADYAAYQDTLNKGQIDNDGYYIDKEIEDTEDNSGLIHISFAKNNNLNIQYYSDEAHKNVIEGNSIYVKPGSALYADVEVDKDVKSSEYTFSKFSVYEYDEKGERTERQDLETDFSEEGIVFIVPKDEENKEYSVAPTGCYVMRKLSLTDHYLDEDEEEYDLNGTWIVNDKRTNESSIEISPISSYIISYEYDSNEYFYISSEPSAYYANNDDGIVIFNQKNATDDTEDYSVTLHKYITVTLVSDKNRLVKVNDGEYKPISLSGELDIDKLKYGEQVTIETDTEWESLGNQNKLLLMNSESITDEHNKHIYRYTLIVPEKGGEFVFNPKDYKYEHGTITFRCFGSVVKGTQLLAKGSIIYYEQESADKGYWLEGKNHSIIVGDAEETKNELESIHFTPIIPVEVDMPQPEYGGKIVYSYENRTLKEDTLQTYSGEKIELELRPWEGWILDNDGDKYTYTVTEAGTQVIKVNGKSINELFKEDEEHKPQLKLTLEKNVGTDMQFTVRAANGYSTDVQSYGGGWNISKLIAGEEKYDILTDTQEIISGDKIGTAEPIQLTIQNKAVQNGKAVKLSITKTTSDKGQEKELRYIPDLSKKIDPIYIYAPEKIASAKTWYKEIYINIDVVDVNKFNSATAKQNSSIVVRNSDTGIVVNEGDLIEDGQKVQVTVEPTDNYYLVGKNISNGIYTKEMKYSEYVKNITEIIDSYNVKKYMQLSLDKSDTYATYIYKLDGQEVSGTIKAKEGQKLELNYEINDDKHKLTEKEGGVPLVGWGASETHAVRELELTSDYDGKTITRDTYGIGVK